MFLGQEPGLSRLDLVDRSLALDVLVDYFFLEWSKTRGRTIAQADRHSWHSVILSHAVLLPYLSPFSPLSTAPLVVVLSLLSASLFVVFPPPPSGLLPSQCTFTLVQAGWCTVK